MNPILSLIGFAMLLLGAACSAQQATVEAQAATPSREVSNTIEMAVPVEVTRQVTRIVERVVTTTSDPQTDLNNSNDSVSDYFPMTLGSYWIFQGTVAWENQGQVVEVPITWRMEVLQEIDRGHVRGYAMRGHPSDLAFYAGDQEPSEYAYIIVNDHQLYRTDMNAFLRLMDESDILVDLVRDVQLYLDLPLRPGKMICETSQITRQDLAYCAIVAPAEEVQAEDEADPTQPQPAPVHFLVNRTLGDQQLVGLAPGTGIVSYSFTHFGTTSEVRLELTDHYQPATAR